MLSFTEQFIAARRVGVPLIGIESSDPAATMKTLAAECCDIPKPAPLMLWNSASGVVGLNAAGERAAAVLSSDAEVNMPFVFLSAIADTKAAPQNSIIGMQAADDWFDKPVVRQAVWNLRDNFKKTGRTLVMLAEVIQLPSSLKNDVIIIEEPLPDEEQLTACVKKLDTQASQCDCGGHNTACKKCSGTGIKTKRPLCSDETVGRVVEAVKGLPYFGAEQVVAMALRSSPVAGQKPESCIDLEHCWAAKRKQVEQTKGLSIHRGGETFADLGGLMQVKEYLTRIMTGRKAPKLIVWLDEIEKTGLANRGDTSGVNQDQEGTLLSWMEDYDVFGVMLLGVPGCLADDTYVSYLRGKRKGGARRLPIAEFCEKFNNQTGTKDDGGKTWQTGFDTHLHSFDEQTGEISYNKVKSVWFSGEKPCIRVETADGGCVTLTTDHPILVADGSFKEAGEIAVGDELLIKGDMLPRKLKTKRGYGRRAEVSGLTYHPFGQIKKTTDPKSGKVYEYKRARRARLVLEAKMNGVSYTEFVMALKHDGERCKTFKFLPTTFDVHHDDENTLADVPSNLDALEHAEHTRHHTSTKTLNVEYCRTTRVVRIDDAGVRKTYDIEMESPHNFVVNDGIIVHNCGKSAICKAVGAEFDRVVIRIDLGAMQGSLVGQSQNNIRAALKVVQAIGGSDTLWLATSNSISGLSSAMKSRFTDTFFFDLPPTEERQPIWKVWLDKYGLKEKTTPKDDGWVARNIKKCCDKAFRMDVPLEEAAAYITPVGLTDREDIQSLRKSADGRYLSASHTGVYKIPKDIEPERALSID
jgi:hypothetical protein